MRMIYLIKRQRVIVKLNKKYWLAQVSWMNLCLYGILGYMTSTSWCRECFVMPRRIAFVSADCRKDTKFAWHVIYCVAWLDIATAHSYRWWRLTVLTTCGHFLGNHVHNILVVAGVWVEHAQVLLHSNINVMSATCWLQHSAFWLSCHEEQHRVSNEQCTKG